MEFILDKEVNRLEKIMKQAQKRVQAAPEGFLRIAKKENGVEYYHKGTDSNNVNGKYIKKSDMEIARSIVQRDYDLQIIKASARRIKAINTFREICKKTNLEDIYNKMNPYRKSLIQTVILPDEEYIKQWLAVEYKGKSFEENAPEIITEKGERVRSKSEKIIADKLYALGVPYRYECPLILDGNVRIYPDFTILKMPEREEVYLEHFGMLDDSNYVESMLYKLKTYERNGIYLGVNLFITHETGREPLNTRTLDRLIRILWC